MNRRFFALSGAALAASGAVLVAACAPQSGGTSVAASPAADRRANLLKSIRDNSGLTNYDENAATHRTLALQLKGATVEVAAPEEAVEDGRPSRPGSVRYPVRGRVILQAQGQPAQTLVGEGFAVRDRTLLLTMAQNSPAGYSMQARCSENECARLWLFVRQGAQAGQTEGQLEGGALLPILFLRNATTGRYAIQWSAPSNSEGPAFLQGGPRVSAEEAAQQVGAANPAPAPAPAPAPGAANPAPAPAPGAAGPTPGAAAPAPGAAAPAPGAAPAPDANGPSMPAPDTADVDPDTGIPYPR